MATPKGSEWVTLAGATSTLLAGSWAIRLTGAAGLGVPGPSRGDDLEYAQQDGADAYPRYRGPGAVLLSLTLDGTFDEDGNVVVDPDANGLALFDLVTAWPDLNNRECTITWHRPGGTKAADARFERFTEPTRHGSHVWKFELLFTIPAGTWT